MSNRAPGQRHSIEFQLALNPALPIPIYRQIMEGIRALVAAGRLRPGAQLPSIRELCAELRINPASAVKAYNELRYEGLIELDQGRGTFVRHDAKPAASREALLQTELEALL